jgi:hypothetical protein
MGLQVSQVGPSPSVFSRVGNYVSSCWSKAQANDAVRVGMNAEAKTIAGLYAAYCFPIAALAGATAANIAPREVNFINSAVDGVVNGVSQMSKTQKTVLAAAGVACMTFFGPSTVFTTLGVALACKLGAEFGLLNLAKEIKMEAVQNRQLQLQN